MAQKFLTDVSIKDGSDLFVDGKLKVGDLTAATNILHVASGTADTVARFTSGDNTAKIIVEDDATQAFVGAADNTAFFGPESGSSAQENLRIDGRAGRGNGGYAAYGSTPSEAYKFRVTAGTLNTSTDANYSAISARIEGTGTASLSADRYLRGLHVDVDSDATGGDTNNELRIYGGDFNVKDTGDADLLYGLYVVAENEKTSTLDNVTTVVGVRAQANIDNTAGTVTSSHGVHGTVRAQGSGTKTNLYAGRFEHTGGTCDSDITNTYGVFAKVVPGENYTGTITTARGLYGEVEISTGNTISNSWGVQSIIDHNGGTATNAAQFRGSTTGTIGNSYGIYSTGAAINRIDGKLSVNTTAVPTHDLTVGGDIKLTGNQIFDDGEIISDGTNFGFDGKDGKEVYISSARDVRIIIDDNDDDTNTDFNIYKHSVASGNELLTIDQSGNASFAGGITGTSAQFIDTTNPDGGGGAGEGGSLIVEGRRDGTANLISLRARDASAPTVALPNGQGGLIRWQGFDGTDFAQMGAIAVVADGQAVANSDAPSKMVFYTVPDASEALTPALTLDKSQNATFTGDVTVGGGNIEVDSSMSSSPTSIIYLDVDGSNTDGGGGSLVFSTSATSGTLTNYNAQIRGVRASGGDGGDSQLEFWTTLVSDQVAPQRRMYITKEGDVVIEKNLTVNGTTTILNTETVEVEDNILLLNKTGTTATAATSGISIYRGSSSTAGFIFDDTDDTWDLSHNLKVAGSITTPSTTGIIIDTTGNALLTIDGASGSTEAIIFKHAGTEVSRISHSNSTNLVFSTGSSVTTALTLDTSQNATFAGSVNVNTNGLINFEQNPDVDTGTEVVAQVTKATYTAAFFDFVIKKGTNVRAGVVYACHDGSTGVEYAETSTVDLGDTSDVTLSVDLGSSTMRLLATTTSNDWSVKSLIRAI